MGDIQGFAQYLVNKLIAMGQPIEQALLTGSFSDDIPANHQAVGKRQVIAALVQGMGAMLNDYVNNGAGNASATTIVNPQGTSAANSVTAATVDSSTGSVN